MTCSNNNQNPCSSKGKAILLDFVLLVVTTNWQARLRHHTDGRGGCATCEAHHMQRRSRTFVDAVQWGWRGRRLSGVRGVLAFANVKFRLNYRWRAFCLRSLAWGSISSDLLYVDRYIRPQLPLHNNESVPYIHMLNYRFYYLSLRLFLGCIKYLALDTRRYLYIYTCA